MDDEMRNSKCQCIQNLLSTNSSGVPPQQMSKITRRPSASASASPSLRWGLVKQTKRPLTMLFSALVTIVFGPCFLQIQRIPIRGLLQNPATWIENVHLLRFFHAFGKFPETKPPPRQVPKKSLWYDPAQVQGNATSEAPSWASKAAENFPWWDTLAKPQIFRCSNLPKLRLKGLDDVMMDGFAKIMFFLLAKFQQRLELTHFF